MTEITELKTEIEKLKERNRKVETNKAWETSMTRKLLLMFLTYFVIILTLLAINNPDPYRNAIVPSFGFFLSTLTLPFVKNLWKKYIYKNN
jgi:hypothetical protein